MSAMARITVYGSFTATHVCAEDEPHPHTWDVAATIMIRARTDYRSHLAALDRLLNAWTGKRLPPEIEWSEDIAKTIFERLNCVHVKVTRQDERMSAEWPL